MAQSITQPFRHLLLNSILLFSLFPMSMIAAEPTPMGFLQTTNDPYYVHQESPKLITPQWVGEEGVEAVIVLAIDDMRDPARYESYLRPILNRLKKIDGRAPLSIMTNDVSPDDPQLQTWLKEGLSIEVHTIDHPCPLLAGGDFSKAKSTYDRCVDKLALIPGNTPVAFRMPCCDSLNTPSPRFYQEIFAATTPQNRFLAIDSSVFNVTTSADPDLPKNLTTDDQGRERFRKYIPFTDFVNTIENYPYPYVIGGTCWQFPCMVPSDWEAQHLHQPNNPQTVKDLKTVVDVTVIKQGVFNLVFHPHGWIRNDQIVDMIDYAVSTYGKRVKFLTFPESLERLNQNLLGGVALRKADGSASGSRVLDLNGDGFMDVIVRDGNRATPRIWQPKRKTYDPENLPAAWSAILDESLEPYLIRDLDGNGQPELIVEGSGKILTLSKDQSRWIDFPYALPPNVATIDKEGRDAGLRFVDLNNDGALDCLFSNSDRWSAYLFMPNEGWTFKLTSGTRDKSGSPTNNQLVIPPFVRADGTNNGVWFHSNTIWWQNEDTNRLKSGVDRLTYRDLVIHGQTTKHDPRDRGLIPIGAASINIDPDGPIRTHGYAARTHEATEIVLSLFAKALAIGGDDDLGPAILLTVDSLGVSEATLGKVAQRLKKRGVRPERIAITTTHTHSAPVQADVATTLFGHALPPDQQQRIEAYSQQMIDKLVIVAERALAARRPGMLAWARGKVTFAANRRTPGGPVDHSLPVLRATDADGKLIAILANYACHCTTLTGNFNKIHGDWAGVAAAAIEKANDGAIALISIGCGADSNPSPRGKIEQVQQYGQAIADEVARLLNLEFKPLSGNIACRYDRVDLPFDTLPTKEEWQEQAKQDGVVGYRARKQLEKIERDGTLANQLRYPIATWTFGDDLAMVFLAGEVVVDYAIRLKEEFDADRLWINAYSNDSPCYIPSRRIWREGGYEGGGAMVYYNQPARLAEDVEGLIVDTVQRLLPHNFYSAKKQEDYPAPQTPTQALTSFKIKTGMTIELVAAEPAISDPVAFDWGPDGRLWVVEMHDYPLGIHTDVDVHAGEIPDLKSYGKPAGRIKVLTDKDGDGFYETSKLFMDKVSYPSGIKVWRHGVIVTAAPEIFFAADADGDDHADVRETLYVGFGEGNQQHRVNGLRWGLDNWLHVGNGDSGGKIRTRDGAKTVNVGGRDLRIRPDIHDLEVTSGQTQFGRSRDDFGNWFGGNNSEPMWHYVLEDRYLKRNPFVAAPSVRHNVCKQSGNAPIFAASRTLARFNDFHTADRFTSACSPIIYRDENLDGLLRGNMFVCEPVHNLVHRELVTQNGITFSSERLGDELESEFLASTDNWFRPTMVRTGPDGAIWVADMYRFVIEHPEWIPKDAMRKIDVRSGSGRGRIYRIFNRNQPPRVWKPLEGMSASELVDVLNSPNGWQRDMAHQMLLWNKSESVIPQLEETANSAQRATSRVHALSVLDGLNRISTTVLLRGIRDDHPGVRRNATRISETKIAGDNAVFNAVRERVDDEDPLVRIQVAYTLGYAKHQDAGALLAKLALDHQADSRFLAAVLSSVTKENIGGVLATVFAAGSQPSSSLSEQLIEMAVGMGDKKTFDDLLSKIAIGDQADASPSASRFSAITGLLDGLRRANLNTADAINESSRMNLEKTITKARTISEDANANEEIRLAAIRLISRSPNILQDDYARFAELLSPTTSTSIQIEAVRALGRFPDTQAAANHLLDAWSSSTPVVRREMIDSVLNQNAGAEILLAKIENGTIKVAHIDARTQSRLLRSQSKSIQSRAKELLASSSSSSRKQVVKQYTTALALAGDIERGKLAFGKHCATCHKLEGAGHEVGPDLNALTDRSPHALLTAVLDPNRAVEDKFVDYLIQTVDGRQVTGMLANETSNSVTLRAGDNKEVTLLRTDIERIKSTGLSLMPEGLEKDVPQQTFADIIAYVRSQGPAPKSFPGNVPELVTAANDGSLLLTAVKAKLYGPRIVFEQKYRNLGWWASSGDRAIWNIRIPESGTYVVKFDYASSSEASGNRYVLSVSNQVIRGSIDSTGTWDDYQTKTIGQIDLPAGEAELVIRSDGGINSSLLDLRTVILIPK